MKSKKQKDQNKKAKQKKDKKSKKPKIKPEHMDIELPMSEELLIEMMMQKRLTGITEYNMSQEERTKRPKITYPKILEDI